MMRLCRSSSSRRALRFRDDPLPRFVGLSRHGMRVLITGGAGFSGSHLAQALVEHGAEVHVLDDLSSGHLENLDGLDVQMHVGSVLDHDVLALVTRGVDYTLHHAARPALAESIHDPHRSFAVNVQGTLNVLEAARQARVKRVIYAASSSAYGEPKVIPTPEGVLLQPVTPYAAFKLQGELLCQSWYRTFGLETVCLRYFNIFGERQDPKNPYAAVIPLFVEAFRRGMAPMIFGDGLVSRDFTPVANVVAANLAALTAPGVAGKVYNIGTGTGTTLIGLVQVLNHIFGMAIEPVHAPARHGDVRASRADIRRATLNLGYIPAVDLAEGLRKMVAWEG